MVGLPVPVRQWLGSSLVSALGVGLAVASLWSGLPRWLLAPIALATAVGLAMTRPGRDGERSAFVRGDASGSHFEDVFVDGADSFIEGDAKGTVFHRVVYRTRANVERLARRARKRG